MLNHQFQRTDTADFLFVCQSRLQDSRSAINRFGSQNRSVNQRRTLKSHFLSRFLKVDLLLDFQNIQRSLTNQSTSLNCQIFRDKFRFEVHFQRMLSKTASLYLGQSNQTILALKSLNLPNCAP